MSQDEELVPYDAGPAERFPGVPFRNVVPRSPVDVVAATRAWGWAAEVQLELARKAAACSPLRNRLRLPASTEKRLAEEQDRREWITAVKGRLGLVVTGEMPYRLEQLLCARCWPQGRGCQGGQPCE